MNNKYCLITTTTDNEDIARKIINILLEKRLVSCIQSSNVNSSYHWRENIESSNEILLQMKSKKSLYSIIEKEILKIHNYEIPQIISYDISNGYDKYLTWIDKETF